MIGRTFTGTPGQPSTSTGGPNEIKADIDALMKAVNESLALLGIVLAVDGTPDDTDKLFYLISELESIVDGSSGADKIGATPLSGGTANTIQGILEELKSIDTSTNVKLTGNQTIAGIKNYLSSIVSVTPTASNHLATKGYIDNALVNISVGTFPEGSVTDVYLSNEAGAIKDRVATNTEDIATNTEDIATNAEDIATNAEDIATNTNAIEDLSDAIVPTDVTGQVITIVTASANAKLTLYIGTEITGGAVTLIRNGATAKPLVDIEGVAVTTVAKGYCEVYEGTVNFTMRPSGVDSLQGLEKAAVFTNFPLSTQAMISRFSYSGEGFIMLVKAQANIEIALKIDGVFKFGSTTTGWLTPAVEASLIGPIRFNTRFEVYTDASADWDIVYKIGSTIRDSILATSSNDTATPTTERLNITGSGWIISINNAGAFNLNIDGAGLKRINVQSNCPILTRYETGFILQCATTTYWGFVYIPD